MPPAEPISKKGKNSNWRSLQSCWVRKTMALLGVINAIPIQKIHHTDQLIAHMPHHSTAKDKRKEKDLFPPKIEQAPKRARVRFLFHFSF